MQEILLLNAGVSRIIKYFRPNNGSIFKFSASCEMYWRVGTITGLKIDTNKRQENKVMIDRIVIYSRVIPFFECTLIRFAVFSKGDLSLSLQSKMLLSVPPINEQYQFLCPCISITKYLIVFWKCCPLIMKCIIALSRMEWIVNKLQNEISHLYFAAFHFCPSSKYFVNLCNWITT